MLPATIHLVDRSPDLVRAWKAAFSDAKGVHITEGDFFSVEADAIVSPANSFGYMNGGLDLAIVQKLGAHVETEVQQAIANEHFGELPVGSAVAIETQHPQWPYLIAAPTMRVPMFLKDSLNPYLSFRAALLAARAVNMRAAKMKIRSILCSGMGTGIGAVPPTTCARQMRIALHQVTGTGVVPPAREIQALHRALVNS